MELLSTSFSVRKPKVTGSFLAGLAAVVALLYFGRIFFITVTTAVILAFILDPLVALFMRMRMPRGLASFFTCSLALLFVYFGVLAFYTQALGLLADLPAYSERINELVDVVVSKLEHTEASINNLVVPKRLQREGKTAQIISAQPPAPQKSASSAAPPSRRPFRPSRKSASARKRSRSSIPSTPTCGRFMTSF